MSLVKRLVRRVVTVDLCAVRRVTSGSRGPKTVQEVQALQQRTLEWARSPKARDSIALRTKDRGHYPEPKNTYHYAQQRGFTGAEDGTPFMALSGLLSNPLTVSAGIRMVGLANQSILSLLIVGARSEATLPLIWWKETLRTLPQVQHLRIIFSGVDMPHNIPPMAVAEMEETSQHLAVTRLPAGAFHNTTNCEGILADSDVCFLLNPGIGHPILKEKWRPTMQMLCDSQKRIVSTAHGDVDIHRDEQELRNMYDVEWIQKPVENPFVSMRATVDANEAEQQIVIPNRFIYAWKGKGKSQPNQDL